MTGAELMKPFLMTRLVDALLTVNDLDEAEQTYLAVAACMQTTGEVWAAADCIAWGRRSRGGVSVTTATSRRSGTDGSGCGAGDGRYAVRIDDPCRPRVGHSSRRPRRSGTARIGAGAGTLRRDRDSCRAPSAQHVRGKDFVMTGLPITADLVAKRKRLAEVLAMAAEIEHAVMCEGYCSRRRP